MPESPPPEDEYDRLDSPSHAGTLGDTTSTVLSDVLMHDLTYENSDDGAARHRAHCPGGMLRALDALRYSRIPA